MFERLSPDYFAKNTLQVAKALVGQFLVHELNPHAALVCRIVETEAYMENDPACHAYVNVRRREKGLPAQGRSLTLFGPPGIAYVYLNYGVHWLFNVTTEKEGVAGAVLIRALEPVNGVELMRKNRPTAKRVFDLTNGPGKLSQAMGITSSYNGLSLGKGPLYFAQPTSKKRPKVVSSTRIGISQAQDLPWRFYEKANPFVSVLD